MSRINYNLGWVDEHIEKYLVEDRQYNTMRSYYFYDGKVRYNDLKTTNIVGLLRYDEYTERFQFKQFKCEAEQYFSDARYKIKLKSFTNDDLFTHREFIPLRICYYNLLRNKILQLRLFGLTASYMILEILENTEFTDYELLAIINQGAIIIDNSN